MKVKNEFIGKKEIKKIMEEIENQSSNSTSSLDSHSKVS